MSSSDSDVRVFPGTYDLPDYIYHRDLFGAGARFLADNLDVLEEFASLGDRLEGGLVVLRGVAPVTRDAYRDFLLRTEKEVPTGDDFLLSTITGRADRSVYCCTQKSLVGVYRALYVPDITQSIPRNELEWSNIRRCWKDIRGLTKKFVRGRLFFV